MKLYPCVLLGDFGTAKLADTITTEQQGRWSTTDNTNFSPALNRSQVMWDRKSMRIGTNASTASGDRVVYGDDTYDLEESDVMNAFGSAVDDFTWCTNLGCWLYHTDNSYSGGDPDQFKFIITDGSTPIEVYWPTNFNATDKWIWTTDTPDSGSFSSNGANIERFGFEATAAFTASSYFYINTFVAYRTSDALTNLDFTPSNALSLASVSVIPRSWNAWAVNARIRGRYVPEMVQMLREMETVGVTPLEIVRRPTPKYQALRDCDVIKTYLMEVDSASKGGTYKPLCVPIIISDVETEWVAPFRDSVEVRFTALRFAGV